MEPAKSSGSARYDAVAEWYAPWVRTNVNLVCSPDAAVLPDSLAGERWLDVACGTGRTARELARRGASVVGVDLSRRMIEMASAEERSGHSDVTYQVADVTAVETWWDGRPFDGATCEMAFMDIDDLVGTVESVFRVLRPGAAFVVSLVHPCFPGNESGLSSWPPDEGYETEGFWTSDGHNPQGVRIRVGSSHRTLATYLNVHHDAGFDLQRVYEPPAAVPNWVVFAFRARG